MRLRTDTNNEEFYEHKEGNIGGFSLLENLKNTKRKLQSVIFRTFRPPGPKKDKTILGNTLTARRISRGAPFS
jgi:hypothetical protein